MLDPLSIMKLVPKAKMLVALLTETMKEYDENVKKYNIKPNDTKEYNKLKAEIEVIMEKDVKSKK